MNTLFRVLIIGVVGAALLQASANASLELRIAGEDLVFSSRTLTPQGGGVFTYINSADVVGGASFNIDVTITTNAPGTSVLAELLTVQVSARQSGAGNLNKELYFEVTDDTFTQPLGSLLVLNSEFSGSFSNQNNTGSLTSSVLSSDLSSVLASVGPHAIGTSGSDDFSNNLPFALRNLTFIELEPNASANTSSRTWVEVIPEPGTIFVWGLLVTTTLASSRRLRSVI